MFRKALKFVVSVEFALWVLAFVVLVCYFSWIRHQGTFKGIDDMEFRGVQNHLVWDVKGKCYFAKPITPENVRLVQVPDCDKEITIIKDKK